MPKLAEINFIRKKFTSDGPLFVIGTRDKEIFKKLWGYHKSNKLLVNEDQFCSKKIDFNGPIFNIVLKSPHLKWEMESEVRCAIEKLSQIALVREVKNGNIKYDQEDIIRDKRQMWDNQLTAASFIEHSKFRSILRDEPRMGKCFSVLSPVLKHGLRPLILAPKELLSVWEDEISFFKDFYNTNHHIFSQDDSKILKKIEDLDLDKYVLIIDESHRVGDTRSKRHKRCFDLAKKMKKIVLLSGNDPHDDPMNFYGEIRLIHPTLTKDTYKKRYMSAYWIGTIPVYDCLKDETLFRDIHHFYLRQKASDFTKDYGEILKLKIKPTHSMKKEIDELVKSKLPLSMASTKKIKEECSLRKGKYILNYCLENNYIEKGKIVIFTSSKKVIDHFGTLFKNHIAIYSKSDFEKKREIISDYKFILINSSQVSEGFYIEGVSLMILADATTDKSKLLQMARRGYKFGENPPDTIHLLWDHQFEQAIDSVHTNFSPNRTVKLIQQRLGKLI